MAHPILHSKSSAKKFGGKWEDYIHLHEWLDETKAWYGHSLHRMFRHHSEGIFQMEKVIVLTIKSKINSRIHKISKEVDVEYLEFSFEE